MKAISNFKYHGKEVVFKEDAEELFEALNQVLANTGWHHIETKALKQARDVIGKHENQMKVYITFGQVHRHEIDGKVFDKDCVGVINCIDHEHARQIAFNLFDGVFFSTFVDKPDMSHFPRGVIEVN